MKQEPNTVWEVVLGGQVSGNGITFKTTEWGRLVLVLRS